MINPTIKELIKEYHSIRLKYPTFKIQYIKGKRINKGNKLPDIGQKEISKLKEIYS